MPLWCDEGLDWADLSSIEAAVERASNENPGNELASERMTDDLIRQKKNSKRSLW